MAIACGIRTDGSGRDEPINFAVYGVWGGSSFTREGSTVFG